MYESCLTLPYELLRRVHFEKLGRLATDTSTTAMATSNGANGTGLEMVAPGAIVSCEGEQVEQRLLRGGVQGFIKGMFFHFLLVLLRGLRVS